MSSSNPSPTPSPTPSQRSFLPQAWRRRNLSLGLLLIFVLSLWLRFWQLNRLNTLIFDEIYFADHGFSYLKQLDLFDVHPPLGKYFLALGIWLHAHLFGGAEVFRAAREVGDLDAIAYRWLNAFTGSLIPLLVGAIAYQWTHRDRLTLLAAGFTALDGLLLVESRLSLINIYLLFFGLLGLWCFGQAIAQNMAFKWLIAAGLFWGTSASVKWNGLGFWLGFFILYSLAWILEELQQWRPPKPKPDKHKYEDSDVASDSIIESKNNNLNDSSKLTYPLFSSDPKEKNPLRFLKKTSLLKLSFSLGFVPFIFYRLQWIPHLQLHPKFTFLEMQRQILGYHESIGSSVDDHPYCSAWHSWIWMRRPVAYYFERLQLNGETVIIDIHAMGNPILWWLSTLAICALIGTWLSTLWDWWNQDPINGPQWCLHSVLISQYAANFLPWAAVSRCTYIYHYMAASLLAFITLAWWIDLGLRKRSWLKQLLSWTVIILIIAGFIYWLPIYIGLPLSPEAFHRRMWFRSWY